MRGNLDYRESLWACRCETNNPEYTKSVTQWAGIRTWPGTFTFNDVTYGYQSGSNYFIYGRACLVDSDIAMDDDVGGCDDATSCPFGSPGPFGPKDADEQCNFTNNWMTNYNDLICPAMPSGWPGNRRLLEDVGSSNEQRRLDIIQKISRRRLKGATGDGIQCHPKSN